MNPALGTTNSPQDIYLNARRARRAAQREFFIEQAKTDAHPLAGLGVNVALAQLVEEDAADVLSLTRQTVRAS